MSTRVTLILGFLSILQPFVINSQIIGSSVVTSVSVITGNEDATTVPSVTMSTKVTTASPVKMASQSGGKVVMVLNQNSTDPGVLSVIATLKNIVEEEHLKQKTGSVKEAAPTIVSAPGDTLKATEVPSQQMQSPVAGIGDDDEAEAEALRSTITSSKVPPTEFPQSMVVVKPIEASPELEPLENDTTSAEVHQAIHRISGALLKPGKKTNKPIENILSDVLKSIQGQRNSTLPITEVEEQPSATPPTTKSSLPPTANPTIPAEPEIGAAVVGNPSVNGGSQSGDESSLERETEEDMGGMAEATKPPRFKPPKNPIQYFTKPGKKNVSTTIKRPTEFYDDEIFGYDPYQTFLHGVYVNQDEPEDPIKMSPVSGDVPHHYHVANMKQTRPPFLQHNRRPIAVQTGSNKRKPVPTLPDHLHRPRPSHLQYQHSAADTIDTETGLTAVKVQHPGQKFTNHKQNLEADRLGSIPGPAQGVPVARTTTISPQLPAVAQVTTHRSSPPTFPTTTATSTSRIPIFAHSPNPVKVDHGHPTGSHGAKETPATNQSPGSAPSIGAVPLLSKPPPGNPGLEGTITHLDKEMKSFVDICNQLGLRYFSGVTNSLSMSTSDKNTVLSPFTIVSSLGLLFLGARGSTAAQLDALLTLDDQMTFNPHLMYHNITQSFLSQSNTAAAIIRLLIADKNKGDVLDFFKMRVQHFYDARVEEVDYKYAGHLATSIINQMIRAQIQRHSYEMLNGSLPLTGPLTLLTSTFFDGQFGGTRDLTTDSLDFIHLADMGRQLIPVPALALRGPFRAAYEETLDVTAVELPYNTRDLSLILLLPGKAGEYPIGGLEALKKRLKIESWTALMRSFTVRDKFKVVLPRFRHHSSVNLTQVTQRFGLTEMFRPELAKFRGINGLTDLYLDQNLMHYAELSTHEKLSDTLSEAVSKKQDLMKILRPHVRGEPLTLSINDWIFMSRTPANAPLSRINQNQINSPTSLPPLSYTRIRSGKNGVIAEPFPVEEKVIRFDRPFLYVLRHNPTGFLLMIGQYTEPSVDKS